MKGDLVYEMLGEIDLDLVAEALPDGAPAAMPLMEVTPTGEGSRRPRGHDPKRWLVICACLLVMAAVVTTVAVVLSHRGSLAPFDEPTLTDSDDAGDVNDLEIGTDAPDARYRGTVSVYDPRSGATVVLENDPTLLQYAWQIKSMLNEFVTKPQSASTYNAGDYVITAGEIEVWFVNNGTYACIKDRENYGEWELTSAETEALNDLVAAVLTYDPSIICTFQYDELQLHVEDDFVVDVRYNKNMFTLKEIYLREAYSDDPYEIPNSGYTLSGDPLFEIPDVAPYGSYEAVAVFTYGEKEYVCVSPTRVMTVVATELDPCFPFSYDQTISDRVYTAGDTGTLTVTIQNGRETMYRYGSVTCFYPQVSLYCETNGLYAEIPLKYATTPVTGEGKIRTWQTGERLEITYSFEVIPDEFVGFVVPGTYHLVLTYGGYEEIFKNVLEIAPSAACALSPLTHTLHQGDSYSILYEELGMTAAVYENPVSVLLRSTTAPTTVEIVATPMEDRASGLLIEIPADAICDTYDLVVVWRTEAEETVLATVENFVTVE